MSEKLLSDEELASIKYNSQQAKASLACEGIYFTEEEEALFESFQEQRLSHEERRRRLITFSRAKRAEMKPAAAE